MKTKLTLTLEKNIIEKAKSYASENQKSLSEIIENYFTFLLSEKEELSDELSPKLKRLKGIAKADANLDPETILKEEIIKKHG